MKHILIAATAVAMLSGCASPKKSAEDNPFLSEYDTPFQVPPFEKIKMEHYKPAFLKGMEEQAAEINAIVNDTNPATFENTIVALDQSGKLLNKVSYVFYSQNGADTNDEMDKIGLELSPLLSKHEDDIMLNEKLFARIKSVHENQDKFSLNKEQTKLLEETYKNFVRGGANLDAESQKKLRDLNSKISLLELTFGQNVLKETNNFELVIDNKKDLSGLPQSLISDAAKTAKEKGKDGKWIFTLQNPSVMPFLQYADNRSLREKIFKAYINRGNNNNKNDNKEIVKELIQARLAKAKLMGYDDYASFVLEKRMAKTSDDVYNLLNQVWKPALAKAKEELKDINDEIKKDGGNFTAEAWDWRYYADRAKKAKFSFDENELRPYLKLENVRSGMFAVANKLYGVTFTPLNDIPLPHPDAQAFECKDSDGTHLGVIYFDFFARPSKSGGAWCGSYRSECYEKGKKITPIVTIVCNFSKPAEGLPALLNADEALTMFHEFGHGLHGLFCNVHYLGVSDVPRDFVELPSQVMEHWAFQPEVLALYAKNYKTGEVMPQELVDKLDKSAKYGQGFATVEYLAASSLDMDFHTMKSIPNNIDVMKFENETLSKRGLMRQIPSRYRTTYFGHTMEGGYTAGYYSYLWAEVLDCDAFQAFKETGNIFNHEVSDKFRKYILTPGGIDDAMDMYVNFRGKKPGIDALLVNRGLE